MTQTPHRQRFLLRHPAQTQGFREPLEQEPLENAIALTMLWIPPGRFWMGSPAQEPDREDDEGPLHLVQLEGFFMGQTPITQAQWREVAGWQPRDGESWGRELQLNPSYFHAGYGEKGGNARLLAGELNTDQRPVEQVSWEDAIEFCNRLSQRTGRHYSLPSEAQWEYACRAGSSTPFHFGETISPELANYDGNYCYADGPSGEYRQQTTSLDVLPGSDSIVKAFPANAWGLLDMHGNVWEWCLDQWHPNYEGAPEDGSAWLGLDANRSNVNKGNESYLRLLRGGSWDDDPGNCRSAYRDHHRPGSVLNNVGLRVVCLPQGCSS